MMHHWYNIFDTLISREAINEWTQQPHKPPLELHPKCSLSLCQNYFNFMSAL